MIFNSPEFVEIGKKYNVPCVLCNGIQYPVLLPAHIDGSDNCLFNVEKHYHIDFRFFINQKTLPALDYYKCSGVYLAKITAILTSFDSVSISDESAFFFIRRWYEKNSDKKLKNNRCTHQNIQIINSCGTCPGHGLIWNLKNNSLQEFKLPFFLEMSNDLIPNANNPRGIMKDKSCKIIIEKEFLSNGNVIMTDSNNKRYGNAVQSILPTHLFTTRTFKKDEIITFNAKELCA